MEDGWISSIAYAQNETFEPLQPSVAGKTVLAELENGLAGECFRIVLGERYGSKAVTYGNTVMQIRDTVLPLSFQGKQSVIVTPGCQACSDAVQFPIQPGERCRLWLYVEGEVASCSATLQAAVHSKKGNYAGKLFAAQTQAPVVPGLEVEERLCGVSALQVHTSRGAGGHSIVAFGDSITQMGYWTNPLRRRIQGANKNATLLNMGIGGNKLLRDTHIPQIKGIQMFGEAGLKRFAWDVAQQPGVKAVVLALGINDITLPGGMPGISPPPEELCSLEELCDGYRQLTAQAHAAGLNVAGCTITPFGGYTAYTEKTANLRNEANSWIRDSGVFDAVIDFAEAVCQKGNEDFLRPEYDSGDHLHPNEGGGLAMAECVDVPSLLRL